MFPLINLFCMFLSLWVAYSPRFRTADVKRNWFIYRINMVAVAINAIAILIWLFNWVSA